MTLQKITANLLGGIAMPQRQALITPEDLGEQKEIFTSYIGVLDGDPSFDTAAEVAALVQAQAAGGDFELIWETTVPAQQRIRWGSGSRQFPANQGRMHFFSMDTGIDIQEGVIRLVVTNARGLRSKVVGEFPTQRLHLNVNTSIATMTPVDEAEMQPLPVRRPWVREDSRMQIWHKTTQEGTVVDTVDFQIPVTIEQ